MGAKMRSFLGILALVGKMSEGVKNEMNK